MKKTRVLIVEDSPTVRLVLEQIVAGDPRLELATSVSTAEAMLAVLESAAPDVISMDIRLPGMSGLDATYEVMRRRPTPIVVLAAGVNAEDGRLAMQALRAGALAVLEKPAGPASQAYRTAAQQICDQLVLMGKVKVVRQTLRRPLPSDPAAAAGGAAALRDAPARIGGYGVVGIVASTGGPQAVQQLLTALGPGFPMPVLLVQHIMGSFVEGFADWLADQTPFQVRVAAHGEAPQAGTVYIPPADRHLLLGPGRLDISAAPPAGGQRPSGSLLLASLAEQAGPRGIGVLLTGMGSDGADGLLRLRQARGHTIAEDASTAVVHGMPGTAIALGAAAAVLPLGAIAPHIRTVIGQAVGEGR